MTATNLVFDGAPTAHTSTVPGREGRQLDTKSDVKTRLRTCLPKVVAKHHDWGLESGMQEPRLDDPCREGVLQDWHVQHDRLTARQDKRRR